MEDKDLNFDFAPIEEEDLQVEKLSNCEPPVTPSCDCCLETKKEVTFNPCEDMKEVTVENVLLKCEGRFLKVKVKFNKVCTGRKVIIGVIVCDDDTVKGFRTCEITIPGTPGHCVDNVAVGDFCFVIPEENLCTQRKFKVTVVAHYSSFTSTYPCI